MTIISHADILLSTPVLNTHALQIRVLTIVVRPHAGTIFRFIVTLTHMIISEFTHVVLFHGFCRWSGCMRSPRIDLWAVVVPLRYSVCHCGFLTFWGGVIHPHTQAIACWYHTQQVESRFATITHNFL